VAHRAQDEPEVIVGPIRVEVHTETVGMDLQGRLL
jgi:hypothetical protein